MTWIALEGGEGSGKSTQARLLAARLGPDAVLTREPGGTPLGERMRAILLDPDAGALVDRAEALLMAADRAQHYDEVVVPALAGRRAVVSDRSAWSSLAYQGFGRGLDLEEVRRLSDWATGGHWPDVVVLVAVPVEVAAGRLVDRPDRFESAGAEFHRRVADGFVRLARDDATRWRTVDGVGTVEEVAERVWAAVSPGLV